MKAVGRKRSAKQKAFGTALARAVFLLLKALKSPKSQWGAFQRLEDRERRGVGRGFILGLAQTQLCLRFCDGTNQRLARLAQLKDARHVGP